ncbi:MAG TPA: fumarylacetoacetate hydrolase family protein [Anaerolineaceae bacterium]
MLAKYNTGTGGRWAWNGYFLPPSFSLMQLLDVPRGSLIPLLEGIVTVEPAMGTLLAPLDEMQEVWASGVTYLRSREARKAESATGDIYERVYDAERPELFFKAAGWRVVAPGAWIRVRGDSHWNVPEPELTLVLNRFGEIVGYTAGNDVSSRDIEGANPLYLPQAKVYNGSCALGGAICLVSSPDQLLDLQITLQIWRDGRNIYSGETNTSQMKRGFGELADYLFRELAFPHGAFLMTGTGIVPGDGFSLVPGDTVRVRVGEIMLENPVGS